LRRRSGPLDCPAINFGLPAVEHLDLGFSIHELRHDFFGDAGLDHVLVRANEYARAKLARNVAQHARRTPSKKYSSRSRKSPDVICAIRIHF
jgi:hypothetical protein